MPASLLAARSAAQAAATAGARRRRKTAASNGGQSIHIRRHHPGCAWSRLASVAISCKQPVAHDLHLAQPARAADGTQRTELCSSFRGCVAPVNHFAFWSCSADRDRAAAPLAASRQKKQIALAGSGPAGFRRFLKELLETRRERPKRASSRGPCVHPVRGEGSARAIASLSFAAPVPQRCH